MERPSIPTKFEHLKIILTSKMAVQGEREQGVLEMNVEMLEPMAQDEIPEQDISVQEQFPPQTNPELEMGAAAEAAVDDTPTPPPSKLFPGPQRNRDR